MKDFIDRVARYFLAVAEHGSVSAAAKALHIGQPAISIAMAGLEKEVGVKLFVKKEGRMVLSPQGQRLERALRQTDRQLALEISKALATDHREPIRFGVVTHWARKLVVPQLSTLENRFGPLHAHFGYSLKIFEQVKMGELDFGIISWANREPRWPNKTLIKKDPEAIVGLKSKFAHIQNAKSWEQLEKEPWIWHRMPQKSPVDYWKGIETSIVVDGYEVLKDLIFAGKGIAAVQLDSFTEQELKKLVHAPILARKQGEYVNLYLVYNDDLEPRTLDLMQYLKREISERD